MIDYSFSLYYDFCGTTECKQCVSVTNILRLLVDIDFYKIKLLDFTSYVIEYECNSITFS